MTEGNFFTPTKDYYYKAGFADPDLLLNAYIQRFSANNRVVLYQA